MSYGDGYAMIVVREAAPDAQARRTMTINGFKAMLMHAPKLADNGSSHGLPTGEPIPVFPVDMLPGCPDEWLREPGSYVCPVDPNWGLWFDWTMNDEMNTAVLPTVKGMNPITGQKLEGLTLEEYRKKCPVHDKEFQGDMRFCEECGYKWPPQSYVCSPNIMWWDGFRQADGTVRQFFFSEDEAKDIASLVIGKKNTVPAFGFAFFQPKVARAAKAPGMVLTQGTPSWLSPSPSKVDLEQFKRYAGTRGTKGVSGSSGYSGTSAMSSTSGGNTGPKGSTFDDDINHRSIEVLLNKNVVSTQNLSGKSSLDYDHEAERLRFEQGLTVQPEFSLPKRARDRSKVRVGRKRAPVRSVAVGAGAMIRQDLSPDTLSVADWKSESAGIIRLYFCFEEQFKHIVGKGVKDIDGDKEGFMKGLPTE